MERRGTATDRHGRVWAATVLDQSEAEAEDLRFWREELTPEQRVAAVEECLASALAARGIDELPRLRRVSRVVERPRRSPTSARYAPRAASGAEPR
jgi:hypothetical protein